MRAVLCGYYGMGNGGDEALLASLLQLLPSQVDPIVLSGNPIETTQRYGVDALPRKSLRAIWSALRQSQVLIWGGGSLMQDATSALNPLYYGGLMGLAQGMGLSTIAWAQGIGPLRRQWTQRLTQHVLQRCGGISVRDRASAALLEQWNIPHLLAPDPVWTLTAQPPGLMTGESNARVAVALRGHPWLTSDRLNQIAIALKDFQATTQTELLLVPFQLTQDLAVAQTIQSRLQGPNQIVTRTHPTDLKGVFQQVSMVIGMRFHALVMAAAEGCRCFALSYDPKVLQLMAALSLPGWDLDPTMRPDNSPYPPLPTLSSSMTDRWVRHYTHGQALQQAQIDTLISDAYQHQALLQKVVALTGH